ncbi:MAG: hypothetical protein U1A78_02590 [Polyangia bacterium]
MPMPRTKSRTCAVVLVLCSVLASLQPTLAVAGSAGELCQADRDCRKRADAAAKLYNDRKFAEALDEYQAAYELRQDPFLLLNIGRCLFRLGRPRSALTKYELLQKNTPDLDPATARSLEKYMAEAKAALDEEEKASPKPPTPEPVAPLPVAPPPPPPPEKKPVYKQWWFWTAIGGAAVAVGLGVGLGLGLRPKADPYSDFVWR